MTARFKDKVAIVTGGSSGIGAATARRLASEGARVVIADLQSELGAAVAAELEHGAFFHRLDVAEEADWAALMTAVVVRGGRLDVMAHCAGTTGYGSVETTSVADWRHTFDVNALGAFLACRYSVEAMRESGGTIVNVASTATLRAVPGMISYSASKAAVLQITRCTAIHCGQQNYGIRCNAVLPGVVDTPMVETLQNQLGGRTQIEERSRQIHVLGRMAQPGEIAAVIAFLASDDASFITASAYAVDGGKMEI